MRERGKGRQVYHPISLKKYRENKADFTRMTKERQDSFSCVKLRRRVTKKGEKK